MYNRANLLILTNSLPYVKNQYQILQKVNTKSYMLYAKMTLILDDPSLIQITPFCKL